MLAVARKIKFRHWVIASSVLMVGFSGCTEVSSRAVSDGGLVIVEGEGTPGINGSTVENGNTIQNPNSEGKEDNPTTNKGFDLCASCTRADECGGEQDFCLQNSATQEKFCSRACSASQPCPSDFSCTFVSGQREGYQCVPKSLSCQMSAAPPSSPGTGSTSPSPEPSSPAQPTPSAPAPGDCDPNFRGPFCTGTSCDDQGNCEVTQNNARIIGYDKSLPANPTLQQIREYTVAAINVLRSRTCLPPLVLDDCLNTIAEAAYAAGGVSHGYFIANCMNSAHNYGRNCQCNWAQENGGASAGSGRTLVDGIQNPLCRMMTEPFGQGHRANIECKDWKRIGIGGKFYSSGASWLHEFGCDASLSSCPKR